ncbi:hypothetical protein NPX13_g11356 [Xylaria arbuscula]|uniref:Uncharacterized protein n=1 Tax=Xylaria arbuscula TaxID=114810 RepID=A0A9W8N3A6_9PEZI|nr:hypothetical protein NPX13_g11356 [Xylaria arbuscula]
MLPGLAGCAAGLKANCLVSDAPKLTLAARVVVELVRLQLARAWLRTKSVKAPGGTGDDENKCWGFLANER